MSKHMQLTVEVRPYYKKSFEDTYPRLARHLGYLQETRTREDPSLYEIVKGLEKLLYRTEADPPFRSILLEYGDALRKLHKNIEKDIADWHLAEADRLLYEIEDIFDEIELSLSKL